MYVISLHYKVPLDVIDAHRAAHLEWLQTYYEAGYLIASGRKNPITGGIILCKPIPRAQLDGILAADPFVIHDLADVEVIEFLPHMTAAGFESLKG